MITDELKLRADEIKNADPKSSALLNQAAQQITLLSEQFAALSKRQSVAGKAITLVASKSPG